MPRTGSHARRRIAPCHALSYVQPCPTMTGAGLPCVGRHAGLTMRYLDWGGFSYESPHSSCHALKTLTMPYHDRGGLSMRAAPAIGRKSTFDVESKPFSATFHVKYFPNTAFYSFLPPFLPIFTPYFVVIITIMLHNSYRIILILPTLF